jgi:hypothetical protein
MAETVWQRMPKAEMDKLYGEYSAFKDDIRRRHGGEYD